MGKPNIETTGGTAEARLTEIQEIRLKLSL